MRLNKLFAKGFVSIVALTVALICTTHAQSRPDLMVQFKRYDQLIYEMQQENERLMREMRTMQRTNDELTKQVTDLQGRVNKFADDLLKVENIEIRNLQAGQQKLFDQLPILNWGTEKRDCDGIGQHQQVKNVQSEDKTLTLRYLCYDGRTLHLGTEVHAPPEE